MPYSHRYASSPPLHRKRPVHQRPTSSTAGSGGEGIGPSRAGARNRRTRKALVDTRCPGLHTHRLPGSRFTHAATSCGKASEIYVAPICAYRAHIKAPVWAYRGASCKRVPFAHMHWRPPPAPVKVKTPSHLVHVCVQCCRQVVVWVVGQAGLAEQRLECVTQCAGLGARLRGVRCAEREAKAKLKGDGAKGASGDRAGWGRCSAAYVTMAAVRCT